MPNQLTDSHIDEFEERGYVIVHNFVDEEHTCALAGEIPLTGAAARTWEFPEAGFPCPGRRNLPSFFPSAAGTRGEHG